MPCHFTAAFAAGFCTTLVASPVDVVKTRYMNSVPGQYRGALHCALSMLLNEGPTSFYKGYQARSTSLRHPFPSFVWFGGVFLGCLMQVRAVVPPSWVLEHRDVCDVRADSEGRDGISEMTAASFAVVFLRLAGLDLLVFIGHTGRCRGVIQTPLKRPTGLTPFRFCKWLIDLHLRLNLIFIDYVSVNVCFLVQQCSKK